MTTNTDRTVRVFVSSTFRDFHVEREILVKRVFPALRQKLRSRGITLLDIDLRWGITEEQAERGETLPICLAKIDECRPYFIGLLGDRYGWIIPNTVITPDLQIRFPVLKKAAGRSVTEIELRHGILSANEPNSRAILFMREASSTEQRIDYPVQTSDEHARLTALKAEFTDCQLARVERYSSIAQFEARIAELLLAQLEADYAEVSEPDALATGQQLHEAFRDSLCRSYIGHDEYLDQLDTWFLCSDAPATLVTGLSGSGKSSLLANWLTRHIAVFPNDHVFEHYLGATPASCDPTDLLRRLLSVIAREVNDPGPIPVSDIDLIAAVPSALHRASAHAERHGYNWIIVLDGIDLLSSRSDLNWLPAGMPKHVHVLLSSLEGPALETCSANKWPIITIEPLREAERRHFVATRLAAYGKSLTDAQAGRILSHPLSGLPLFLKVIVDELRVFGIHEQVTAQLEWYLNAASMPELFDRLLARHESDFGAELTQSALSLIWGGRAGIEENELITILGTTEAVWQPLSYSLSDNIRESSGRLLIAHEYLRHAIERRYLNSQLARVAVHAELARHFSNHDWPARKAEEWPWQLIQAGDVPTLVQLLADIDQFGMLISNGNDQLREYWTAAQRAGADILGAFERNWNSYHQDIERALAEQRTAYFNPKALMLPQLLEFLGRSGLTGRFATHIALETIETLRRAKSIDPSWRQHLATALEVARLNGEGDVARAILQRLDEKSGPTWRGNDATSLQICSVEATLLADHGQLDAAISLAERTLTLKLQLLGERNRSSLVEMNNLASWYRQAGRLDKAQQLHQTAYDLRRTEFGPSDEDTLVSMTNLGGLLMARGMNDQAAVMLHQALERKNERLGPHNISTLITMFQLAECLRQLDRPTDAANLFRHVLKKIEATHRAYETVYIKAAQALATILSQRGDQAASLGVLTDSLRATARGSPPAANAIEELVAAIDVAAVRVGNKLLAQSAFELILTTLEQWQKGSTYSYYYTQGRMGSLLYDRGEIMSAAKMYEGCVRGMFSLAAATGVPEHHKTNLLSIIDAHGSHLLETLRRLGQDASACQVGLELCAMWDQLSGNAGDRPRRIEKQILLARSAEQNRRS